MKTYVVDTHALAWFISRDQRLGQRARAILRAPNVRIIVPAIVLAEIKYLAHRGRLTQTLETCCASSTAISAAPSTPLI